MASENIVNEAEEREVASSSATAAAPEITTEPTVATEATAPTEAEEPQTEEPTAPEDIFHEMDALARRMGLYSEGVDYLIDAGAPDKIIDFYSGWMDAAAAEVAAQILKLRGTEKARFMNHELRTDDEQKLVQEVALKASAQRLDKYSRSLYIHSLGIIARAACESLGIDFDSIDRSNPETEALIEALNVLNRYFYIGLHKELNPLEVRDLSEAEVEELRKLSRDYISFHKAQGKPPAESVVEYISASPEEIIELNSQSDVVFLPLALAFRDQADIARNGKKGRTLNVGKKTKAGTVEISVYVSDKDGNPLTIDAVMKRLQSTIGQLIDENGRVLPLIVTPQQIYRAYARLKNDAKVTEQQVKEIERAMDALITSPSLIDFRAQLEKHTKIKQQNDYDYTAESAGKELGNLITGVKRMARDHHGEWRAAYWIYEYPVFYRYSHVVGQIARVPNVRLIGDTSEKSAVRDKKTHEALRTPQSIGIRAEILTRIEGWRTKHKKHQPYTPVIKFSEIASDCNITLTENTERTLKKNIQQYLDELKGLTTRNGGIKDYQPRRSGRKVVGFLIEF